MFRHKSIMLIFFYHKLRLIHQQLSHGPVQNFLSLLEQDNFLQSDIETCLRSGGISQSDALSDTPLGLETNRLYHQIKETFDDLLLSAQREWLENIKKRAFDDENETEDGKWERMVVQQQLNYIFTEMGQILIKKKPGALPNIDTLLKTSWKNESKIKWLNMLDILTEVSSLSITDSLRNMYWKMCVALCPDRMIGDEILHGRKHFIPIGRQLENKKIRLSSPIQISPKVDPLFTWPSKPFSRYRPKIIVLSIIKKNGLDFQYKGAWASWTTRTLETKFKVLSATPKTIEKMKKAAARYAKQFTGWTLSVQQTLWTPWQSNPKDSIPSPCIKPSLLSFVSDLSDIQCKITDTPCESPRDTPLGSPHIRPLRFIFGRRNKETKIDFDSPVASPCITSMELFFLQPKDNKQHSPTEKNDSFVNQYNYKSVCMNRM